METKTIQLDIPEYLTVEQYKRLSGFDGDSKFERLAHIVSSLTGYSIEDVQYWSIESLVEIIKKYQQASSHENKFYAIIEWNGTLYGYSDIKSKTLGEYIDLENLTGDLENNLHKIAALMYRPVTKHRFKSLTFAYKQKVKMLNNDVENVFDWYEVEKYDSKKRKEVEEEFKAFPIHILLGAISFFLSTATLYLNSIQYSDNKKSTKMMKEFKEERILEVLLQNIGVGSVLSTNSQKATYLKLQGTLPSQMLTS